jgi:hypothetical protein
MASGSDFEEVKNAEIPLPCPGILLMFISVGHTSIYERFEEAYDHHCTTKVN